MGRTSRRESKYVSEKIIFKTAIYLRLSIKNEESNSIEIQQAMLEQYIKIKPDLQLCGIYADNGATGTNFNRKAFINLLEDIKNEKINCILVKDLSRLGRNFVETGEYIDKLFPLLGVRFIALNDQYDSLNDKSQLIIPLRNLINDFYAKDISKKICSSLENKQINGDYIGKIAPYGYTKQGKNKIVVNRKTSEVVKQIFNWKAAGISVNEIIEFLATMGINSPREDKQWSRSTLVRMLQNEIYIGNMVQGRYKKQLYKNTYNSYVPKTHWIVVENTHEAIISKELFIKVQATFKGRGE